MKFTLSWLKEHLETDKSLTDIADAMTMAGLEIEHIDNPADRLAAFTVAHVKDAVPHPDADKLRVCTVETVDGVKQIVCGAPNARAGMTAIYAPLGAYIPGLDFALDAKPRKIRGVESHGMLCSTKELEAGEDHDGIADLKGDWPVGTPAAEALGFNDPVIDFEVTPNRPDWLGVHGIARDLAAAGVGTFKDAEIAPVKGSFPCPVTIETAWPEACPVFAGRVVKGVKNGPSPEWLQKRLKSIGLRPINTLVDITNLISVERARPLHVYDLSRIGTTIRAVRGSATQHLESTSALHVTADGDVQAEGITRLKERLARARPSSSDKSEAEIIDRYHEFARLNRGFVPLHDPHVVYPSENQCVIEDEHRVLGLGGIMGGEYSGCSGTTTDVFIESAWFEPSIIRTTGRETGIVSDARYRFERGVDTGSVLPGLELATRLILDLCGGEASDVYVAGEVPADPASIAFDPVRVGRLTGLDISHDRIANILTALGFGVDRTGPVWTVAVPSWRRDCTQGADLIEEVARIEGYDRLPATSLKRPAGRFEAPATPMQNRVRAARRAAANRGYQEAVTWSFCREDQAALFGGHGAGLKLANPISSELDVMRPSALVHLLLSLQKSLDKGLADPRFFEAGPIYLDDSPIGQRTVVSVVRAASAGRDWKGAAQPDVFDAKADALAILEAAGAPVANLQAAPEARSWWHPGRSGVLRLGPKNILAEFGEIHPGVLKTLGVEGRVLAAEVFLDAIPASKAKGLKSRPALQVSDLMAVRRDFAFLTPDSVPAGDLLRALAGADKQLVSDVALFDRYAGKGVPEGHVSLAVEVTLQPADKTLTDAEIDAVSKRIIAAAEKQGAKLRG
ncbi:phenylalanine--tRNA ligase subunit beta [Glycocaulis sp.]|uniref:phenylalanine--tRNA ligase subunit beta n=1 Tax=Glycocaulis sp. TaxID=1969725 RepID=UPI003F714D26